MNTEQFNKILTNTLTELSTTLGSKGAEYTITEDRLKNFSDAGQFLGCHPEAALLSFVTKHIIALKDFVILLNQGKLRPRAQWQEKTGDIMAYMVLLRALLEERFQTIEGSTDEDSV